MNRKFYISTALILVAPLVLEPLIRLDEARGLLWLLAQQIYYLPISWIGEPLFTRTEVGMHPEPLGIVVGVVIYGVVMLLLWMITRKKHTAAD